FVRSPIEAAVHTLLEAIFLVEILVIVFLQTWRASIIPMLAVPVSVIGTLEVIQDISFSIHALNQLGIVMTISILVDETMVVVMNIGIVVDDAIVVVEIVKRNIEEGLTAREATYKAMREVSGPIVAIALTLCAVFVPLAFVSGLTGQFFKQFALTIAISTVISAVNSLTLSPALSALLLKSHGTPKDKFQRGIDRAFGWFFVRFNKVFHRGSETYGSGVKGILKRKSASLAVYAVLIGMTAFLFHHVPAGFVPGQDKQYLVGFAQLPDAASLDRTEDVIRK